MVNWWIGKILVLFYILSRPTFTFEPTFQTISIRVETGEIAVASYSNLQLVVPSG